MTTVEYQVGSGVDDGWWTASSFDNSDVKVRHGQISGDYLRAFHRFTGVTIPTGSTITAAYLSFFHNDYVGTPAEVIIYFEDAANPTAISGYSDGDGRSRTSAYISHIPPNSGTGWKNTASIKSMVEELIGSYSYAAGAAMQVIIIAAAYGSNSYVNLNSADWNPSVAAILHIEFIPPSGGCQVRFIGMAM